MEGQEELVLGILAIASVFHGTGSWAGRVVRVVVLIEV
jgi:hypothetical protein